MSLRRVQSVLMNRGVGKSGRLLARALGPQPRAVNWTGGPWETAINANTYTNKLLQLEVLQLGNVPIPEFSREHVEGWAGRTMYHTRGRDFQHHPPRPDFWVKMYPSLSEWRMHVMRKPGSPQGNPASYEVFRTGQKIRGNGAARGVEWVNDGGEDGVHIPIRSRDFGWTLKYWRTGTRPNGLSNAVTASKWAVSCLHWDFGAVDLIVDADGKVRVLEVNSCPSLRDEHTLAAYTERLKALMEE